MKWVLLMVVTAFQGSSAVGITGMVAEYGNEQLCIQAATGMAAKLDANETSQTVHLDRIHNTRTGPATWAEPDATKVKLPYEQTWSCSPKGD